MIDNFGQINARILETLRSAIILCDATKPENPIVALNSAFETLTGYGQNEVLGRSCNILQAEDVDQPGIVDLRAAIKQRRPVQCILRNYRKDGSLFYNELFIGPIRNEQGVVTHFVGCQNVIDDAHSAYLKTIARDRFQQLTPKEQEIFELIADGHTAKTAASSLGISISNAEKRRLVVMNKMKTQNLTQLVRFSIALA